MRDQRAPDEAAQPTATRARDARGRFVDAAGRVKERRGASKIGVRGSTHHAHMPFLRLARTLARMQIDLERLEAELRGSVWKMPARAVRPNMVKIAAAQSASVRRKEQALRAVLEAMAERREVPRPASIARAMAGELGAFDACQLYRPPLDTMWRDPSDFLGADPEIDGTPHMRRCIRMHRREITAQIKKLAGLADEARLRRGEQLVAASRGGASGEDWSPIVL